jgi:SH3 domain protein
MSRGSEARGRRVLWGVALAGVVWGLAGPAHAESAWVKGEVRVNLRTGAGTEFRIVGSLGTGDEVEILSRGDGWTQVRGDQNEGWIPAGFLQSEPPAGVVLAAREAETAKLRDRVESLSRSESALREQNQEIAGRDEEQREEITRLTRENLELRAGARWPEWITGAGIVTAGMALGAVLQRVSGRRRSPRIRL